jgi:hypothetical protein
MSFAFAVAYSEVALYAEYNSKNLYTFLEKSGSWDLDKALDVCQKFGHWKEVVSASLHFLHFFFFGIQRLID